MDTETQQPVQGCVKLLVVCGETSSGFCHQSQALATPTTLIIDSFPTPSLKLLGKQASPLPEAP